MSKILIIDDDIFFQKFYTSRLQEKGYVIVIASNGDEGLEKIQSEHPHLILLDLIMPQKDGFDVLKTLKEKKIPHAPVLVFSTLSGGEDIANAMSMGAVGYINKGISDFENSFAKISSLVKQ